MSGIDHRRFSALIEPIANPQVRAAFEQARKDPSIEVRRWVEIALAENVK